MFEGLIDYIALLQVLTASGFELSNMPAFKHVLVLAVFFSSLGLAQSEKPQSKF